MTPEERIKQLEAELAKRDEKIASLESQLMWFRKKIFGKMSEKHLPADPNQLSLFDAEPLTQEQIDQVDKANEQTEKTITKLITVKDKPSRRSLDTTGLPTVETHIYPKGTTDTEGKLLDIYEEIGTEESSRLEIIPTKVRVHKTVRHKVILKSQIKNNYPEDRNILIAEMPLEPIDRCMAGASVLADIVISKFEYHLPFYRIINQYKENGITLPSSTVSGWYEATVDKLHCLYRRLKQKVLESEYIQVDESSIPVMDETKKNHQTKKGYMWCVRDALTGNVVFHYDRGGRGGDVARELLLKYKGILQTDGYAAYDQFEKIAGITTAGCWAHARRKWIESLDENSKHATHAINTIAQLYALESQANSDGLTIEQRQQMRQEKAYPIIREFETWMESVYGQVLPQSRCGKAIVYTFTLLPRLTSYVNDGRIHIDNNHIENAIRPLALGRKNWLFCGNDAAAYRAAIVYSLIGCCKNAGVNPREWMQDVLQKLPYYKRDNKDVAELLPQNWENSRVPHK